MAGGTVLCSPSVSIQPGVCLTFRIICSKYKHMRCISWLLIAVFELFFFLFFPLIDFPLLSLLCHAGNQAFFCHGSAFWVFPCFTEVCCRPTLAEWLHSLCYKQKQEFAYKRIAGIQPESCFASLSARPFAITRAECKIFPLAASPALAVLVLYCAWVKTEENK